MQTADPGSCTLPWLLAAVLALGASAVSAQEWREVKTPPRRDASMLYEFVRQLDAADDITSFAAAAHDQSAGATLFAAEGPQPGSAAVGVRYEFKDDKPLEYIDIAKPMDLPADAEAIGFRVFGGKDALPARIRLVDVSGEVHQYDAGMLRPGQWTLVVASLQAGSSWGGDGNGKLDPPFRLGSILFDRLGQPFKSQGELRVADIGLYRRVPEAVTPHGIHVYLPADRIHLVYDEGATIDIALSVDADAGVAFPATVVARLTDPFGAIVGEGRIAVPSAVERVAYSLTPGSVGAYDLSLEVSGLESSPRAPWNRLRFAVLAPPPAPAGRTPFAVCTHFGQWWPLSVMDLVARAGISTFRDEISWGAVERDRGELSIPAQHSAFIERGVELGLTPLIIADYGNGIYDGGAFPVSEEAGDAFARYAATLVTGLGGKLQHVEVWNEWCGGCGMNGVRGKPEEYAPLFLKAAEAMRRAQPGIYVVGIGGEYGGEADQNIQGMMSQGAGAAMDGLSIHPYHYPNLPGQWFRNHLDQARATARDAAGKDLPLWVTEIGWPTHVGMSGSDFLHQSRSLVRMYTIALTTDGVTNIVWYDFMDDGLSQEYNENNFGLVHHPDYLCAPKPAYVAYAHLIGLWAGREVVSHERTAEGLWQTVLRGPDDDVCILFADIIDQTIDVPLPAGAAVTDLFGRPVEAMGSLQVTSTPAFVRTPR